jgi:hypothetical protein
MQIQQHTLQSFIPLKCSVTHCSGSAPVGTTGCVGMKGARCALMPMGPMPGRRQNSCLWHTIFARNHTRKYMHTRQHTLEHITSLCVSTHCSGSAPVGTTGCVGMKGARCALMPMGPMPGPPPPCGMQKVLCRFKWHTSAPMWPGLVRPTCITEEQ